MSGDFRIRTCGSSDSDASPLRLTAGWQAKRCTLTLAPEHVPRPSEQKPLTLNFFFAFLVLRTVRYTLQCIRRGQNVHRGEGRESQSAGVTITCARSTRPYTKCTRRSSEPANIAFSMSDSPAESLVLSELGADGDETSLAQGVPGGDLSTLMARLLSHRSCLLPCRKMSF